jgi:hypothetical protein
MNTKLLITFAIVVLAFGSVGALAAGTIIPTQQAHAITAVLQHHGCAFLSNGYNHSHGKCFHLG